jgi:predicted RNase H-like HicB family nuclease
MALEIRRGADGRWVAEIPGVPGAIAYGATAEDAKRAALVMALRVVADRIEQGQTIPDALMAAFAVLQDVLEQGGSTATTRVLGTVLRIGSQLKQRATGQPILPPKSDRDRR